MTKRVSIVGAGLSGLACAVHLQRAGVPCRVFEASDGVGGRARTDVVDGFRLDRGFQVLLESYPEASSLLNYDSLDLRGFNPGARVFLGGSFHTIVDPFRSPLRALGSVFGPVGSFKDKLALLHLRRVLLSSSEFVPYGNAEQTTLVYLKSFGFSESIIERFFRPFYGGVFLERALESSASMFVFTFRMFAMGRAVVPARGIGAMAEQLVEQLPDEAIQLDCSVSRVEEGALHLSNGDCVESDAIVVATDVNSAARLLGNEPSAQWRGVTCLYFSADRVCPVGRFLLLNGESSGVINNAHVVTELSGSVAPEGKALLCATVVDGAGHSEAALEQRVREELEAWLDIQGIQHLRTYVISESLPGSVGNGPDTSAGLIARGQQVVVCGDHCETASSNGALTSGRLAADWCLS